MFRLNLETGNAAFDDDHLTEIARILRDVADKVEHGTNSGKVFDLNGNSVGEFVFSPDQETT